jgi:hypothetical protein
LRLQALYWSRGHFQRLAPQLRFQQCQLGFDVLLGLALADDFLAVAAQEIVDRLDSNPDRTGWLVLVEILEAEIRSARLFDDALDNALDRSIMPALEAGDFECDRIMMAHRKLGGPDFVVGAAGVGILPSVGDIERAADDTGSPAYLCRMSTGARVRSRGNTCSCHFTGTDVGL